MLKYFYFLLLIFSLISCKAHRIDSEAQATKRSKPSGKARGPFLKEAKINEILNQYFSSGEVDRMICTACFESRWGTTSYMYNTNGTIDIGLFQINSIHWKQEYCVPKEHQNNSKEYLKVPENNAKCAAAIFERQGIKAWYGYSKNKSKCDEYNGGLLSTKDKNGTWQFCPYPEGGLKKLGLDEFDTGVPAYDGLPKFFGMSEDEITKVQAEQYELIK